MDFSSYELKIFCQVLEDKSFSAAARSLRITQPTISQQIGKLESILGSKLFERVGHDIIPTPLALEFQKLAFDILDKLSEFESQVQNSKHLPEGLVRYAMPESCQWTPHYKTIMKQIAEVPRVRFAISILTNDEIINGLLKGEFDFGFIVGDRISPDLRFQKFSDEAYSAVAADKKLFNPLHSNDTLENMRLITYPGWEGFAATWAKGHGLWNKFKTRFHEPAVHVGTLSGAIHAAQSGAGVVIIPTHCVQSDLDSKLMHEWKGAKAERPSSPVYLAKKVGERQSKRVQTVIDMLAKAKASDK